MNILLIFIILLVIFVWVKVQFHRVEIAVKRQDKTVTINDVEVEYADLQHYIDTQREFESRKVLTDTLLKPIVDITTNETGVDVPDIIGFHIDTDTQNVHDTVIQKNIKSAYLGLPSIQQDFESVKQEILSKTPQDKAEKVEAILGKIQARNAFVTNLNSNELDVIKNMWLSGNDNVKAQLINEILDCDDEHGSLYCPTGITTRITSAIHIDRPDNAPKTKELLNQEVMATFGKYYSEVPDKTLAKNKTIDEYYNIYPRETIEQLIDEWIEHI